MIRALAVDELVLGLELLAADAVEAGVDVLVDVAVVVDALQELLDEALVALVGRADEEVVLRVDASRAARARLLDDLGRRTAFGSSPCSSATRRDLRRMLVHAGEEERLVAALPVVADEDVGRDRRVRVADVRASS